jgi:uncharacterized protein (DUF111 family)
MPEFEQCRQAAARAKVAVKMVEDAARVAVAKLHHG